MQSSQGLRLLVLKLSELLPIILRLLFSRSSIQLFSQLSQELPPGMLQQIVSPDLLERITTKFLNVTPRALEQLRPENFEKVLTNLLEGSDLKSSDGKVLFPGLGSIQQQVMKYAKQLLPGFDSSRSPREISDSLRQVVEGLAKGPSDPSTKHIFNSINEFLSDLEKTPGFDFPPH